MLHRFYAIVPSPRISLALVPCGDFLLANPLYCRPASQTATPWFRGWVRDLAVFGVGKYFAFWKRSGLAWNRLAGCSAAGS